MKSNYERKFLGKLKNFENKEEQKREKKHLKNYLKGNPTYIHGKTFKINAITGLKEMVPMVYDVQEELTYIDLENDVK